MGRQLTGIVKGHDIGKHTQRLVDGHHHIALRPRLPVIGKGLTIEGIGSGTVDSENSRICVDFCPALLDGLSTLLAHDLRDLFHALLHETSVFFQDAQSLMKRDSVPFFLPFNGQRNSLVQIFQSACRHGINYFPRSGIDNVHLGAVRRINKFPSD